MPERATERCERDFLRLVLWVSNSNETRGRGTGDWGETNQLAKDDDAEWRSNVELPISAQGSPLDFLLAQEEVECDGNRIGALAQLFRQIALSDHYVPGWVTVMDIASIA